MTQLKPETNPNISKKEAALIILAAIVISTIKCSNLLLVGECGSQGCNITVWFDLMCYMG